MPPKQVVHILLLRRPTGSVLRLEFGTTDPEGCIKEQIESGQLQNAYPGWEICDVVISCQ